MTETTSKRWTIAEPDETAVKELAEELRLRPIYAKLLINRGVNNLEAAKAFYNPAIDQLHDPFLMRDMDKAVHRVVQAIEKQESVLVYGDYDVDGTCSVSFLCNFLKPHVKKLDYYIPDRYAEGYGVSMQGIEYAKSKEVSLIVALDCGITATAQISHAKKFRYRLHCL